jgi:DHA2 family multidrug resistance protein
MTSPDVKAPEDHPTLTTHPLLEVAGVLLGAMIATCTGPLMNVGSADIRGAMHFVVAFMSSVPTQYRQVVAAPVETK